MKRKINSEKSPHAFRSIIILPQSQKDLQCNQDDYQKLEDLVEELRHDMLHHFVVISKDLEFGSCSKDEILRESLIMNYGKNS